MISLFLALVGFAVMRPEIDLLPRLLLDVLTDL